MNPITTASSKISVQMGSGTKFRLGYISEDYKCSANAPTAGYHFANSFLRRTIFSGHVTVRFGPRLSRIFERWLKEIGEKLIKYVHDINFREIISLEFLGWSNFISIKKVASVFLQYSIYTVAFSRCSVNIYRISVLCIYRIYHAWSMWRKPRKNTRYFWTFTFRYMYFK